MATRAQTVHPSFHSISQTSAGMLLIETWGGVLVLGERRAARSSPAVSSARNTIETFFDSTKSSLAWELCLSSTRPRGVDAARRGIQWVRRQQCKGAPSAMESWD